MHEIGIHKNREQKYANTGNMYILMQGTRIHKHSEKDMKHNGTEIQK